MYFSDRSLVCGAEVDFCSALDCKDDNFEGRSQSNPANLVSHIATMNKYRQDTYIISSRHMVWYMLHHHKRERGPYCNSIKIQTNKTHYQNTQTQDFFMSIRLQAHSGSSSHLQSMLYSAGWLQSICCFPQLLDNQARCDDGLDVFPMMYLCFFLVAGTIACIIKASYSPHMNGSYSQTKVFPQIIPSSMWRCLDLDWISSSPVQPPN